MKFIDSHISCSNNRLSFTTIIRYAAVDGSRTASDLVSLLHYNLDSNNLLWISNATSLSVSRTSPDDMSSTNIALLIGLFIGFGAAFLIILPLIMM